MNLVLDSPSATLQEHKVSILLEEGVAVSVSTLCRAMRRLGLCHQR